MIVKDRNNWIKWHVKYWEMKSDGNDGWFRGHDRGQEMIGLGEE